MYVQHLAAIPGSDHEAHVVMNLATAYQEMGNDASALEYRKKHLELAKESGDTLSKVSVCVHAYKHINSSRARKGVWRYL
jgi:hypothetical protein